MQIYNKWNGPWKICVVSKWSSSKMPARVTRRRVSRFEVHPSRRLYILGMKDDSLWKTLFRTFAWASVMFRGSLEGPELVSFFFYLIDTGDLFCDLDYHLWHLRWFPNTPEVGDPEHALHTRRCCSYLLCWTWMLYGRPGTLDSSWRKGRWSEYISDPQPNEVSVHFFFKTCFPPASWFLLQKKTALCWNWNLFLLHASRNVYEFLRPIHDRLARYEARLLCIHDCCRSFQELSNSSEKQQLGQRLSNKVLASKEPQLCLVFACDEGSVTRWEWSSWHLLKHFLNTCWGVTLFRASSLLWLIGEELSNQMTYFTII